LPDFLIGRGRYWATTSEIAEQTGTEADATRHGLARLREARRTGRARLAADLESGAWEERYGHLREREELDVGLRLVSYELGRKG